MIENLSNISYPRDVKSGVSEDTIRLSRYGPGGWEYRVVAGQDFGFNTWAIFYAKKLKIGEHYVLIGHTEDHYTINPKSVPVETMLGESVRGVAHNEEEANSLLVQICRGEAQRMRKEIFVDSYGKPKDEKEIVVLDNL